MTDSPNTEALIARLDEQIMDALLSRDETIRALTVELAAMTTERDLLEKNARIQAKLLANTGTELARMREANEWKDIESAPKDGTRINLCWEEAGGIPAHVELGKWSTADGWCNTYGKPFHGDADYWSSLPSPPQDGKHSTVVATERKEPT